MLGWHFLGFRRGTAAGPRENAGTHPTRGVQAHPKWGRLFFQPTGPPLSMVRSANGFQSPRLLVPETASFQVG